MTFEAVQWFVWVMASLWAQAQTSDDAAIWLIAFGAAFFVVILVKDRWVESDQSRESK